MRFRWLQPPLSAQAPSGVFEVVTALANRRLKEVAHIGFGFAPILKAPAAGSTRAERNAETASRQPAIFVRPY